MNRRQLAIVAVPLMAVASVVGVVIFEQGWSLAATILIGYGVIAGLTIVGVVATLLLFRHGGPDTRSPRQSRVSIS